jgi:hypothetical protein
MSLRALFIIALAGGITGAASAQTPTAMLDTPQNTTLTANVSEQCQIAVPAGVMFDVARVTDRTVSSPAAVTIDNIVLATATRQLRLSIRANAARFTPPVGGAATWGADDVTWNGAMWIHGAGSAGTLSSTEYTTVATSEADAASMTTAGLTFTLAPRATVTCSGHHTLTITWKVESFGS